MDKKFVKTLFLFIILGFGTAYITELIPFIKSSFAIFPILIALSILVEMEQHQNDGVIRYMIIDTVVDVIGSLGIKKIIDLIGVHYPAVSSNLYVVFAIMLISAAIISNTYNSRPKNDE